MIDNTTLCEIKDNYSLTTCGAVQNKEGDFAGIIDCRCSFDNCDMVKSGYIFGTDKEAIDWAQKLKKEICSTKV